MYKISSKKSDTREDINKILATTGGTLAGLGAALPIVLPVELKSMKDTKVPVDKLDDILDVKKDINNAIKLKNHMGFEGIIRAQDISMPAIGLYDREAGEFIDNLKKQKVFPRVKDFSDDESRIMYKKHGPLYKADLTGTGPGEVIAPIKDKYLLAHELGHSTGRNILSRTTAGGILRLLGKTTAIPAISIGASYDPSKKLKDQDVSTKANLAFLGASSVGAGSVLAEEARASIRGAKALKELKQGTYKDALKKLGPLYATYAASLALAPYVGYKVSRKIKDKLNSKDKDK